MKYLLNCIRNSVEEFYKTKEMQTNSKTKQNKKHQIENNNYF